MSTDRIISGKALEDDAPVDLSLRPRQISDFIGQQKLKDNLQIAISAARGRSESLDHALFYGPPGLGKTTLAHIVAVEMGVNIRVTSGPAIERAGDLAALLTNLQSHDVLFIDEIHRLNRAVEEVLYPAMEDRSLDLVIGKGPGARSLRLSLPEFTLIGATTRFAQLSSPLRGRFGVVYRLDYYDENALAIIIKRSAKIIGVKIEEEALLALARRARGTPRVANRLLRRVRDYAQVKADGIITSKVAGLSLKQLEVDDLGLDEIDHRLLYTIIDKFNGGPVGLETLAAAISEESDTIMDVYEPYLLQLGFIERTPRGRTATPRSYQHLGLEYKRGDAAQTSLFNDNP